ncbi:hypothetical protein BEV13_06795 [Rickettsiella grylli]|uniref:dihydrolipoamide acetyltransferase family protein n=1 Tax=Rickettsiella grylli TaxID=59196 RepID=UPI0008FD714B|nr:dihydrolipoamide acetyltransferase family protein [Rickettsiella grylli]OIZ98430.1 hypothetical protein BEV13_06795 [Rickettsiella grylli]
MTTFHLPDLGEGLPDAEIREWYVKRNDWINIGEPMVAMETAKAVVDIPAPFGGRVTQLYGQVGDIIKTGDALIDIGEESSKTKKNVEKNQATVVGHLQQTDTILEESLSSRTKQQPESHLKVIKATPAIRALAKKFKINLNDVKGTGPDGQILVDDIERKIKEKSDKNVSSANVGDPGYEPLRGVRRTMAIVMKQSHHSIVPVTLVDDADIHAWPEKTDITLRLIRAIMTACQREPRLNAWFDESQFALRQHHQIDLGIAMDAPEGLFVPVIKNIAQESAVNLRKTIDKLKAEVKNRTISPDALIGPTFVLSNIGIFAGRYATPIIIPPLVAILAVGRMNEKVVSLQGKISTHKQLPLSLTVDHRVITGGEAARFLSALLIDLQAA